MCLMCSVLLKIGLLRFVKLSKCLRENQSFILMRCLMVSSVGCSLDSALSPLCDPGEVTEPLWMALRKL